MDKFYKFYTSNVTLENLKDHLRGLLALSL